jgi:hypothetical protein
VGIPIKIVASDAQDQFNKSYRTNSDFFELSDFIRRCAYSLADFYQQEYRLQYAELRSDRNESIVAFDPSFLNEQELEVKGEDGSYFATFTKPVMSFSWSDSSAGVQQVFSVEPNYGVELERYSMATSWQMGLIPYVDRAFYAPTKTGLRIVKEGAFNVKKINVFYVPSAVDKNGQVQEDVEVPDALCDLVVNKVVNYMLNNGPQVIKEAADGNLNKVAQTEINPSAIG